MDTSPHKSDFVNVNGVKLHYLDWGGEDETIIFLTGTGSAAHDFDRIAPRFTDQFRVLALARRAHSDSAFGLEAYSNDIVGFMNALSIKKAILVGHSITGIILTYFSQKYPELVSKLVYLDAVYHDVKGRRAVTKNSPVNSIQPPIEKTEFATVDEYVEYTKYLDPGLARIWNQMLDETAIYDLETNSDGKLVEVDTSSIMRQLMEDATAYSPEHVIIKVPVLCFEVVSTPIRPSYFSEEQKRAADEFNQTQWMPFKRQESAQFRQDIPQVKLIEIPNGHHACFISDEDLVYAEMRKFLLEQI